MILPVLSLYTGDMVGATPLLIGLAIGIYGLTQAMLQIPFGMFSDRIGRKPVIAMGLLLFVIGSVIAALSDNNIYILILGRALQGAGAIAASIMALAADLTRESQRTKTMAIIGITIGMAFTIAFIGGPVLNIWLGLSGLFWVGAAFGLLAIVVLFTWVPQVSDVDHDEPHPEDKKESRNFIDVLKNADLLRLDASILVLHLIMTATFVVLPLALRDHANLTSEHHWKVYLPVMLLSIVFMMPFIRMAESQKTGRNMGKQIFMGSVILLALSEFGLWQGYTSTIWLAAMMLAFFTAFNYLEAALPSLVSRTAPSDCRGAALGVYSTSQFLGAFIGGTIGGWLYGKSGVGSVFLVNAILILIWLVITIPMKIEASKR